MYCTVNRCAVQILYLSMYMYMYNIDIKLVIG